MFGLIVSDPSQNTARREALAARLHDLDLPLTAFNDEPAKDFPPAMPLAAFLRTASFILLQPGCPLPLDALLTHLSTPDPLPANVLRRYLFLQQSLMPYLRPGRTVTHLDGGVLLGNNLLIARVSAEDVVDIQLPPGIWTELTGIPHEGHLRGMRGYQEMPILARENSLLPISINGQALTMTTQDDADRLTLHWFQPKDQATCCLHDGTSYHVQRVGEHISVQTSTDKPFHLIVHEHGKERFIR